MDVSEREEKSIQQYAQRTYMMGGIRGEQDIQGRGGQTSSMEGCSMFAERRFQLNQSWKEEGFERNLLNLFVIGLIFGQKLIQPSFDFIYQPSAKSWQNISLYQELSRLVLDQEFKKLGCD